jgi:C1A family cysteine protease
MNKSAKQTNFEPVDIPNSVDWRKEGAVNSVQDQGNCASCWAFSTVAAMEGRDKIKNGKLWKLSEQQLVDCAEDGRIGCGGGVLSFGFQYAKDFGMMEESAYPYVGYR